MHLRARQYNKLCHRSTTFSLSLFSMRDSHIVISKGVPCDWYVGKIKQISIYPLRLLLKDYFIIQKFRELSDQEATGDPYHLHSLVGGHFYHPKLEDKIKVVTSEEIIAYFTHTSHNRQEFGFLCFHTLPLDKVILLTILYNKQH